jgi:hypothetical protein
LPEDWIPAYREYLAQYQPVDQLFPWSPRRLEYLLEDIGNEAGLGEKHLSFDMCRWTSTLMDYREGFDLKRFARSWAFQNPVARDQFETKTIDRKQQN